VATEVKSDTLNTQKTAPHGEIDIEAVEEFLKRTLAIDHDFNNPLSGILGYAEFLLDESDRLSPEHTDFVKQIIACADRLSSVIAGYCEAKNELSEKMDISRFRSRK
jgi:signal transduction histidine kinase